MSQIYKEMILRDINDIPANMLPGFYKVVHLLKKELIINKSSSKKRSSLKGIWKGSEIDERLFDEAKRSMFKYD